MGQNKYYEGRKLELIKSFLRGQEIKENYEVWTPYEYHGITGFIDLVVESGPATSTLKFLNDGSELEQTVKELKLERLFFTKSRGKSAEKVYSFLVLEDNKKNRKSVLYKYSLLAGQPFEIIFLNKNEDKIESISELKETLPKLFQTRKIRLENEALKELILRPNHKKIERAILECKDSPREITGEIIEKMDEYLKYEGKSPEKIIDLEKKSNIKKPEAYQLTSRTERRVKNEEQKISKK